MVSWTAVPVNSFRMISIDSSIRIMSGVISRPTSVTRSRSCVITIRGMVIFHSFRGSRTTTTGQRCIHFITMAVAVMSDLGGNVAERGKLTEGLIGVRPAMWSGRIVRRPTAVGIMEPVGLMIEDHL